MNRDALIIQVEEYLNGMRDDVDFNLNSRISSEEQFKLNTARRLINAWKLYHDDSVYKKDFFLALRDYLIVMETDIHLPEDLVPDHNGFSIGRDAQKGTFFATLGLPEGINRKFVEQAFQLQDGTTQLETNSTQYNLQTDPFVYRLTGYVAFKTIAQKLAVYGALRTPNGYTTMVSLPTGGGKSLITQTIAYQDKGLTIVIVPTISLAIDQVRASKKTIRSEQIEREI